jgi:nicotinamidase-related amidase
MALKRLSSNTLHVVIDMQRIFAEETAWHTPAIATILPNVVALSEAFSAATLFVKFMLPQSSQQATGTWRGYYDRWPTMTVDAIDPAMQDLVEPLLRLAGVDNQIDKLTYSAFGSPAFCQALANRKIDTIVFSGVETDVCVYASVLDAVDIGLRVVIAIDAVASSDSAAHDAVLTHLVPRLSDQIEIATTQVLVQAWSKVEKTEAHAQSRQGSD